MSELLASSQAVMLLCSRPRSEAIVREQEDEAGPSNTGLGKELRMQV